MFSSVSMRGGRPPRSSRAIADCVVPTSSASSRCERPISARRVATCSAIWAKNHPRSRVTIRSRSRSSGRFSAGLRGAIPLVIALLLCIVRAQPLVEEPAEQQGGADGEERDGSRRGAERGEVVQEDLREDRAEQNEPAHAKPAPAPLQPR